MKFSLKKMLDPLSDMKKKGLNKDTLRSAFDPMDFSGKTEKADNKAKALGEALSKQQDEATNASLAQNFAQGIVPQRAFAPQMQMPSNQGLAPRVQSGMQFGSTPNPIQQPQMMPQRQYMPVFNSGEVPQYGQNGQNLNMQTNQNMQMPQQYGQFNQPQIMPNRVAGVPMNRVINNPRTSPTLQQQQLISNQRLFV